MPGCAASNCTSHSRKKIRLFRFPRCSSRRHQWEAICQRDDWRATDASRLCEKHFEDSHFLPTCSADKRTLRHDAIPTLSDVPSDCCPANVTVGSRQAKRSSAADQMENMHPGMDHIYCKRQCCDVLDEEPDQTVPQTPAGRAISNVAGHSPRVSAAAGSPSVSGQLCVSRNKIRQLQRENCLLRSRLHSLSHKLEKFLSVDQIHALQNRNRGTAWTQETVKKSLQIRNACGSRGYEFLRQTGYPLPGYRTLRAVVKP